MQGVDFDCARKSPTVLDRSSNPLDTRKKNVSAYQKKLEGKGSNFLDSYPGSFHQSESSGKKILALDYNSLGPENISLKSRLVAKTNCSSRTDAENAVLTKLKDKFAFLNSRDEGHAYPSGKDCGLNNRRKGFIYPTETPGSGSKPDASQHKSKFQKVWKVKEKIMGPELAPQSPDKNKFKPYQS